MLDVAEVLGVSRSIPIAIRGEAYDIHVDLKFPQESFAGIDFGPMRVVDHCLKQLVLRNTEKYDVKFSFTIASADVQQLVTITPEAGVVPPGKEVSVAVSQCALRHADNALIHICRGSQSGGVFEDRGWRAQLSSDRKSCAQALVNGGRASITTT